MTDQLKPGDIVKAYGYGKLEKGSRFHFFSGTVHKIIQVVDKDTVVVRVDTDENYLFHPRQLEKVREPRQWILSIGSGDVVLDVVPYGEKGLLDFDVMNIKAVRGGEVIHVREVLDD